jgi:hypothetical protein
MQITKTFSVFYRCSIKQQQKALGDPGIDLNFTLIAQPISLRHDK